MQYILTQQEYDALKADAKSVSASADEELQMLCSIAADWSPGVGMRVLAGCILTLGANHNGFCDRCPVEGNCRSYRKRFSEQANNDKVYPAAAGDFVKRVTVVRCSAYNFLLFVASSLGCNMTEFSLTKSELDVIAKLPDALTVLAEYHDCQASMAAPMGYDESVKFHSQRAEELRAEAKRIESTW